MKRIELLSPAGNLEKLRYAYAYGADAAYIGLDKFSLRSKADNFSGGDYLGTRTIKGAKKLYCALNVYFHENQRDELDRYTDYLSLYPFDAFIISDIGILDIIRKRFPSCALHLSTQANCTNSGAAKIYRDLGFSRIILSREMTLENISRLRNEVPDLELEVFVHGAMCMAYSGRCILSAIMTGRNANDGNCSHPCRWKYRLLEESERPGEYLPIEEHDGFTTILSSKDLCMIDNLDLLRQAGIDAVKIEGRMKSIYYTAVVTRAYRKALDALGKTPPKDLDRYRSDLFKVSHREFSTGFFFGSREISAPAPESYERSYLFIGMIERISGPGRYVLRLKNKITAGETIEYIGPDSPALQDSTFRLFDESLIPVPSAGHDQIIVLETSLTLQEGFLVRKAIAGPF